MTNLIHYSIPFTTSGVVCPMEDAGVGITSITQDVTCKACLRWLRQNDKPVKTRLGDKKE